MDYIFRHVVPNICTLFRYALMTVTLQTPGKCFRYELGRRLISTN